jgi:hypothetical protein
MTTLVKCRWCRKVVREKLLLGTLHICLTDEERRIVDIQERTALWQMQMQRQFTSEADQHMKRS